jgi:hypothetical protein
LGIIPPNRWQTLPEFCTILTQGASASISYYFVNSIEADTRGKPIGFTGQDMQNEPHL